MLDQAKAARVTGQVPVQLVAPMQLPFTSVKDLDHQCQQCHDHMSALSTGSRAVQASQDASPARPSQAPCSELLNFLKLK